MGDLKDAVVSGAGKPPPTPRSCPTCSKQLTRFTIKGIELDLCAECGTTAFDPGELWRLTAGKLGVAPAGPKQGVFEMLWDCASCDTKNLLGKTNRFCPVCGAPQDPKRRRFPKATDGTFVTTLKASPARPLPRACPCALQWQSARPACLRPRP